MSKASRAAVTGKATRIFLTGMMGSGKSYWCKKLASALKTGAYDLDTIIELTEEKTIAEIFATEGEEAFRKTEARILRWFGEKQSFVLATGGGTPCFHDNMQWMNGQGITIWIDEPVDVLVERLNKEKNHRPLISTKSDEELHQFLSSILKKREAFYCQAKHHLQGDQITEKNLTAILKQYA